MLAVRCGFHYHAIQVQNGSESKTDGKVQRTAGEIRAEIVSVNGLTKIGLPPSTLMPVAALGNLVDRLRAKSGSFPTVIFGAEAIGDAFRVDVEDLDPDALRAAPRALTPVAVPATQFWPVSMTFTRDRQLGQKPLFSVTAKIFNSGVLDRLTIDVGIVTVTADLKAVVRAGPDDDLLSWGWISPGYGVAAEQNGARRVKERKVVRSFLTC